MDTRYWPGPPNGGSRAWAALFLDVDGPLIPFGPPPERHPGHPTVCPVRPDPGSGERGRAPAVLTAFSSSMLPPMRTGDWLAKPASPQPATNGSRNCGWSTTLLPPPRSPATRRGSRSPQACGPPRTGSSCPFLCIKCVIDYLQQLGLHFGMPAFVMDHGHPRMAIPPFVVG
ncbi:hypothetical protein E1267_10165 [Nonomuraea longispora]|uniref:Uncharacterized protein n=1 Tax=Nonomuraea longispora TaxID=1848320 RepID=A0A4R4NHH1_9ACTN|nr:hypothetical protein E1267_10165 [Nonomuraea longispora]